MRLLEDRTLREAYRAGCPRALAEVYREYAPAVFALLGRGFAFRSAGRSLHFPGCKDPAELEDLVQEVFSRAFTERARAAYDGQRPYRNYLFTVARNLVLERQRSAAVRLERAAGVSFADDIPVDSHQQPERALHARELADHLAAFLTRLDSEQRSLFDARFGHGRSIESVANHLGITQHRVKREERRLRQRLRHVLRRHGHVLEGGGDPSQTQ